MMSCGVIFRALLIFIPFFSVTMTDSIDVAAMALSHATFRELGAPALLELPTDYRRPRVQTFDSGNVAFTLPEAAAPGTMKLRFTDSNTGLVTSELMLADSLGTTGTHAFSFDSAKPWVSQGTGSNPVMGGLSIPDGVYTVTLSYQDALGESASASSTIRPASKTSTRSASMMVDRR